MKRILGVVSVLAAWQFAAMAVGRKLFPTPIQVGTAFTVHWQNLLQHSAYSVGRLLAGVALALVIGVPLGLLLGYFRKVDAFFSPSLYILGPVPKIALLPLIMLLFGIGNLSKVFIIFIIMVFQVILAARDSVKAIPQEYFMPYRAAKAKNYQILLQIVLPAGIPGVFTALRIGLATSISVLFFAETFGTKWGLGFYIMDMWLRLEYTQMYLGICTLAAIGLLSVFLVDWWERKLCPWKDSEKQ